MTESQCTDDIRDDDKWLRMEEACRYARLSKPTVYKLLKRGRLKGTKRIPGGWIVSKDSIDTYNEGNA